MTENQEPVRENQEPRTQNRGYSFRNLILWNKAQELTLAIVREIAKMPEDRFVAIVSDQILRSASSMGANIAEGHGRYSPAAHANYLSIAKASACETDNFLDLLRRGGYLPAEVEAKLHADCEEVIRMLTAKILDLGRIAKPSKGPRAGEERAIYYTAEDYARDEPGSGFSVLGSGDPP
jgi:four helix bundle protein